MAEPPPTRHPRIIACAEEKPGGIAVHSFRCAFGPDFSSARIAMILNRQFECQAVLFR